MIRMAMQMNYPIIVVDGFCQRPMDSASYKLLTTNGKREATLTMQVYIIAKPVTP